MTDLDPVIHTPARLRIMTTLDEALEDGDEIAFPALQKMLAMTSGNLTSHLAKLEDAGYVAIAKTFAGKKPVTLISLTPAGRGAFRAYRTTLLDILGGSR
ncbi:transcriptional regulator [Microbacterium dextranolyticum]|uniref:MarR family transcriptional regulator n=1 Tax=Microbacterium dextranolyticum TaxID=36806 RepID=A0A9W6HMB0_9MICO|nr:transcriptional regulator [Microbacterium dextranolyticum]MBM7464339.1 DNA-binding MarR family transcriptional regulator [Microbacterium dextranolyticum]GLJ95336.1 MarR family transcriptional regulator [Microbacterium dextranolyticum]